MAESSHNDFWMLFLGRPKLLFRLPLGFYTSHRPVEIQFWLIGFLFPVSTLASKPMKLTELVSIFCKEDISELQQLACKFFFGY